ncbi:unnamed protein product [Boreogadus saida]
MRLVRLSFTPPHALWMSPDGVGEEGRGPGPVAGPRWRWAAAAAGRSTVNREDGTMMQRCQSTAEHRAALLEQGGGTLRAHLYTTVSSR